MTTAFIIGFLCYCTAVVMMYDDNIKSTSWFQPAAVVLGVLASFTWSWVAKHTTDPEELYVRGLIWDAMLLGVYSILPLFLGVKLTPYVMTGTAVVVLGFIIIKVGG